MYISPSQGVNNVRNLVEQISAEVEAPEVGQLAEGAGGVQHLTGQEVVGQ